jgi:hypothetical protein
MTPAPLSQVHLKLHIVTPAVYTTPAATVASRLLVRVLDDLLLPTAYPAELAGTCYSLGTGQGGLVLKVTGFQGVAQTLMGHVLSAMKGERGGGGRGAGGGQQGRCGGHVGHVLAGMCPQNCTLPSLCASIWHWAGGGLVLKVNGF